MLPHDHGVRHVGAICNPVLLELDPERRHLDDSNEGCLSVPTAYAELPRPDYAEVRGQDQHGNEIKLRGTGYFARCLQHEVDHLNGVLFVDHISALKRNMILRKLAKEQKLKVRD